MGPRAGFLALAIAVALTGCGSEGTVSDGDGDVDVDAPARGTVTLLVDDPLLMHYHEVVTLEGAYLDGAGEGAETDLEVSLQGTAHDTTLSATSVRSHPDGTFSFDLAAGSHAAEFTLRVLAADGAGDEIDVSIEVGSGSLSLEAAYPGRRAADFYRLVIATGDVTGCPSYTGDPILAEYTPDATLPYAVAHLPEAVALSVVLSAGWCPEGVTDREECDLWVHGCLSGVTLSDEGPTDVVVEMQDDVEYFAAPTFNITMEIDARSGGTAWVDALLAPAFAAATEHEDDPARFILDGIYERVLTQYGTADGDLFAGARLSEGIDAQVDSALDSSSIDLTGELSELESGVLGCLDPLVLEGFLEGDFWSERDVPAVHDVERFGCEAGMADTAAVLAADAAEVDLTYDRDMVTLNEYTLPIGLGETLVGLVERVVRPSMVTGVESETLEQFLTGLEVCDVVVGQLWAYPAVQDIATREWYVEACTSVLEDLAGDIRSQAELLDASHTGLVLQGSCDFLNSTGYANPDRSCQGLVTHVSWGVDAVGGDHLLRLENPWD
jgi:hypothetical protein